MPFLGRTPHGVRELKRRLLQWQASNKGRTPHGVRELKLVVLFVAVEELESHPARGA